MTLIDIINRLKNTAKNVKNINYVGDGDIYTLSTFPNLDYSVFFVTQTNHSMDKNTINYTLTLFYVDRLLNDSSNRLQIQSTGIVTLTNIINKFVNENDVEIDGNIQFTTFNQRFADECSGVFANVTFVVDNNLGICDF